LNLSAQSKKDQIISLQLKCDSLNTLLAKERLDYQSQLKQSKIEMDSSRNLFEIKMRKIEDNLNILKLSNDSLIEALRIDKEEINRLNEKINELASIEELSTEDADKDITNQLLALKKIINSNCTNENVKDKIILHVTNRYNTHLHVSDSLSTISEEEGGGYEELSFEMVYLNKNFLAYEVVGDAYYGGAHPEQWVEQYIFDLRSGALQDLERLIPIEKRSKLLLKLNENLKLKEQEMINCLENNEYSDLEFTMDHIKEIRLVKDGISIEYWLSYAERACNPIVFIKKNDISNFFVETLFE
jgi:hypothetical protein